MKISVVLPCFNGVDTLGVQLDALARQVHADPWELIYVDNGSTDGSLELAESYRDRIPDLRILQAHDGTGQRKGVANSYAMGFAAATGDAFVTCEADDEVGEGWLAAMAKALETHEFIACAVDYTRLNPPELVWGEDGGGQTRATGIPRNVGPLFLPLALGCTIGLKRSVYEAVGGPTEDVGPVWDADYCFTAQRAGFDLHFVPDALYHYRVRTTLQSRFRQARIWGRSQALLRKKWSSPRPARYLAYVGLNLVKHSFLLAAGSLAGKRPRAYWAWGLGFAFGQLQGLPVLLGKAEAPIAIYTAAQDKALDRARRSDPPASKS